MTYDPSFPARQRRIRIALDIIDQRRKRGGPDGVTPPADPEKQQRWYTHLAADVVKQERIEGHRNLQAGLQRLNERQAAA